MGKQAYIIIHEFEKSYERMAPPLEVIVAVEHSLFWGKFISINLNCQEKMDRKNGNNNSSDPSFPRRKPPLSPCGVGSLTPQGERPGEFAIRNYFN